MQAVVEVEQLFLTAAAAALVEEQAQETVAAVLVMVVVLAYLTGEAGAAVLVTGSPVVAVVGHRE
jgi:hypothetical protein